MFTTHLGLSTAHLPLPAKFSGVIAVRVSPYFSYLPNVINDYNFGGNQAMTKRSKKSLDQRLELIRSGRGCLKREPEGVPFSRSWMEYKEQERKLDEKRFRLLPAIGKRKR
jgi:hypothetical protein